MAMIRIGNWKGAQQVALKMHKTFVADKRYLPWAAMCALLQAQDPLTSPQMKEIVLSLALRLFENIPLTVEGQSNVYDPDRVCLLLEIYTTFETPRWEAAFEVLDKAPVRSLCETSLAVDEYRRRVFDHLKKYSEEASLCMGRLEAGSVWKVASRLVSDSRLALGAAIG